MRCSIDATQISRQRERDFIASLVPKLRLGNALIEAPASRTRMSQEQCVTPSWSLGTRESNREKKGAGHETLRLSMPVHVADDSATEVSDTVSA